MIIDCHGHYTTAPKALETWRNQQIAGIKDPSAKPKVSDLKISDDEIRESIANNQLRLMKERGNDLTLFSPRASYMARKPFTRSTCDHQAGFSLVWAQRWW